MGIQALIHRHPSGFARRSGGGTSVRCTRSLIARRCSELGCEAVEQSLVLWTGRTFEIFGGLGVVYRDDHIDWVTRFQPPIDSAELRRDFRHLHGVDSVPIAIQ